jgi:hypothetical protein
MNLRHFFARNTTILVACLLPIGSALACPVLNDGENVFQGNGSFTDDFQVSTSGNLTVSIAGVPSPNTISDYEFILSSQTGTTDSVIGTLAGPGSIAIPVNPGTIYFVSLVELFGTLSNGVSSLDLNFVPAGVTPVPLPGSLALLLPGLGLAFARRSRRVGAVA